MTTQLSQQIAEKAKKYASKVVQGYFYPDIQAKGASEESEIFEENLTEDLSAFVSIVTPLIIAERDREWKEEIEKHITKDLDRNTHCILLAILGRMEAGK